MRTAASDSIQWGWGLNSSKSWTIWHIYPHLHRTSITDPNADQRGEGGYGWSGKKEARYGTWRSVGRREGRRKTWIGKNRSISSFLFCFCFFFFSPSPCLFCLLFGSVSFYFGAGPDSRLWGNILWRSGFIWRSRRHNAQTLLLNRANKRKGCIKK